MAEAEPSRCVPGAVRTSSPEPAAEPPISASLPPAFCLLLSAFCFLPSAFCLLPPAACLLLSAFCRLPPSPLRPRLVNQIERRLRRPSQFLKSCVRHYLPHPLLASLRAQTQPHFLRPRGRRANHRRCGIVQAADRI